MSEEDKQGVVSLISNLVLLGTAGWGLRTCYEHPFISAGFGLFAVRGLVGTIAFFWENGKCDDFLKGVDRAATLFFCPLIAAEVMERGCTTHLAWPLMNLAVPLVQSANEDVKLETLVISRAFSLAAILYCDYKMNNWNNIYLIIPFAIDIVIWQKKADIPLTIALDCMCLVAALVFNEKLPPLS